MPKNALFFCRKTVKIFAALGGGGPAPNPYFFPAAGVSIQTQCCCSLVVNFLKAHDSNAKSTLLLKKNKMNLIDAKDFNRLFLSLPFGLLC